MAHTLKLELNDELYNRLSAAAHRIGRTPEEYLLAQARAVTTLQLPKPSEALRKFAGAVCVPDPRGLSNEAIDDDLAREYGDPHKAAD